MMIRGRWRGLLLICGFLALTGPRIARGATSGPAGLTSAQWRQDLAHLVETLEKVHPDLYGRVNRATFSRNADALNEAIPGLKPAQIIVRMMQLVALVRDGHTSLEPVDPAGFDQWFPVRFYRFTDGIFITAIGRGHGDAAGARVDRIGDLAAGEAWDRAASLLGSDNEFGALQRAPLYLANSAALVALGVIESPERLTLRVEKDGELTSVDLEAVHAGFDLAFQFWGEVWGPASSVVKYVTAFDDREPLGFYDTESDLPFHLRNRTAYWFTYVEKQKLFYLQINYLGDSRRESFDTFFERLWKAVDGSAIDLFALDIRYNIGGDGSLVNRIVHEFIKRERINRNGRLFTIVGRATFSAGVMLTAAMDEHTESVFVGEPMGAYYRHYGDGTSFQLPHSGLLVWVSTIYHQLDSYTGDLRVQPIHLPARFSSSEYFDGKDPALEQVLASRKRPPLIHLFREQGAKAALAEYEKRLREYGKVAWWEPFSMRELNSLGNELRKEERWEDAMAAYRLNADRHPDHWRVWYSLGRAYKEQGEIQSAIEHYEKALAVDPFNNLAPNQRQALKELRAGKSPSD